MTSRADVPLLGSFVADLGRDLQQMGELAWKRSADWEAGPLRAAGPTAPEVCRCGHGSEVHYRDEGQCMFTDGDTGEVWACMCESFEPAPRTTSAEDRSEEGKAIALAAKEHVEFQRAIGTLDAAAQEVRRRFDRVCPPDPAKAKRTQPETAAEVALEGFCSNCWRNDQQMVPITKDKRTDKPIFRDLCEWCGRSKNEYGILPDLHLLRLRHDGRRVTQKDWDAALARHKATQQSGKKAKRKKGRMAA